MKKIILTYFTTFLLTIAFGQFKPEGVFTGIEKIDGYNNPNYPEYLWYHFSVLTIKKNSVLFEQSPIAIYETDTIFSSSDGGFYTYTGTIGTSKGKTVANLKLKSCEYCPSKFVKFVPPIIVTDDDILRAIGSDTSDKIRYHPPENLNVKLITKVIILEKADNTDTMLVGGNIYRRQMRK